MDAPRQPRKKAKRDPLKKQAATAPAEDNLCLNCQAYGKIAGCPVCKKKEDQASTELAGGDV